MKLNFDYDIKSLNNKLQSANEKYFNKSLKSEKSKHFPGIGLGNLVRIALPRVLHRKNFGFLKK